MQRLNHILTRLVFLFPCLLLAGGCGNNPSTVYPTQATGTQATETCVGGCSPGISLVTYAIGLKPGATFTFSATAQRVGDPSVTWSIKEGPLGGIITNGGFYTAPAAEGVYHVIVTAKASPSLSQIIPVAVTATELTPSGKLSTPRSSHTASLLLSGQVFIAGGVNGHFDDFAGAAELYDPAVGKFHYDVQVRRTDHSATVLANGDVLLAGGDVLLEGEYSNTADLRKAGSGLIQPTGSMITPRGLHSATLLQDGRVLLAGGSTDNSGKPMQTAELYDPATGKFASAGNMTTPRLGPAATLLPNGRVLIVGGAAGAELYDPATNTFVLAPGVSTGRCSATATPLADGRVLIAGGRDCSGSELDAAEIYDPSTGQSTPTGKLFVAQAPATATLLPNGRVLLVGGDPSVVTQIYDPATGSFTLGPHLISPEYFLTATLLPDGSVLIVGGDGYDSVDTEIEIYK